MPYKDKQKEREHKKEYYQRPKVKERIKKYRQMSEVKAKHRERNRKYYQRSEVKKRRQKPEFKERYKKYRQRPEIKKRDYEYYKTRCCVDGNFNIKERLRRLLRQALNKYTKKGKITSASKYGINYKKIVEHLKPFPEDISLYHIDHIKPLCSFDLENPEEVKEAFSPENHQWLTISENCSKGGRY